MTHVSRIRSKLGLGIAWSRLTVIVAIERQRELTHLYDVQNIAIFDCTQGIIRIRQGRTRCSLRHTALRAVREMPSVLAFM